MNKTMQRHLLHLVAEYGEVKMRLFIIDDTRGRVFSRTRWLRLGRCHYQFRGRHQALQTSCFAKPGIPSVHVARENLARMIAHDELEGLYLEPMVVVPKIGKVALKGWAI